MLTYPERQTLIWDAPLSPKQKLVVMAINTFVDGEGKCWPSLSRLSRMTGLSECSVRRAISELENLNIAEKSVRFSDRGKQTSNLLRLNFEALRKQPCQPDTHTPINLIPSPYQADTRIKSIEDNQLNLTSRNSDDDEKKKNSPGEEPAICGAKPLPRNSGDPNPPSPPFPARVVALYNENKPAEWVYCDRKTPALEALLYKKLQADSSLRPETLLSDMAAALRFVSSDKYWSKQLKSIEDILRGEKLEEWATKQKHIEAQSKTTAQASEDAARRRENRIAQNQAQIDRNRLEEDLREWWVSEICSDDRHIGLRRWMRFTRKERGRIFRMYEARFLNKPEVQHA